MSRRSRPTTEPRARPSPTSPAVGCRATPAPQSTRRSQGWARRRAALSSRLHARRLTPTNGLPAQAAQLRSAVADAVHAAIGGKRAADDDADGASDAKKRHVGGCSAPEAAQSAVSSNRGMFALPFVDGDDGDDDEDDD